jgi:hypothetical protein
VGIERTQRIEFLLFLGIIGKLKRRHQSQITDQQAGNEDTYAFFEQLSTCFELSRTTFSAEDMSRKNVETNLLRLVVLVWANNAFVL